MINRDDIEAGDKCYTRDGGCLVARDLLGTMRLGGLDLTKWIADGQYVCDGDPHPLDIIRIEKAPKPVVQYIWVGFDDESYANVCDEINDFGHSIKLTIINGKLDKAEQMK